MPGSFTATLDRRQEQAYLSKFRDAPVDFVLKEAAKAGGKAAKAVMAPAAPEGRSTRPGPYYRKMHLGHGTFRKSVKAAAIRGRGSALKGLQGRTVGVVVGPIGKTAFTRHWIERGTHGPGRHVQRANPWVERMAGAALNAAQRASVGVLEAYSRG